jgi:ubiquinone/menaquinone biosynthesis C-methylase UbiE
VNDIDLLKKGIVLPHYRILSRILDDSMNRNNRIMDLACKDGNILEMINILYNDSQDYTGVDEGEDNIIRAESKNLNANFKHSKFSKLKMRKNSYDIVIAQDSYFLNNEDILSRIDNLFRVSRMWVIFFNLLVIPECDTYKTIEMNGESVNVYGINYLREIIGLLEPASMEYTYVAKSDNPSEPTTAIFAIKV